MKNNNSDGRKRRRAKRYPGEIRHHVAVYLDDDEYEYVRALSEENNLSVSLVLQSIVKDRMAIKVGEYDNV